MPFSQIIPPSPSPTESTKVPRKCIRIPITAYEHRLPNTEHTFLYLWLRYGCKTKSYNLERSSMVVIKVLPLSFLMLVRDGSSDPLNNH